MPGRVRERSARRLRDVESLCDLKTGQHARQAARRASHDTQERRLSFRYTRESVKVLCCVTTPAPYAVGRSMCMHLSKHLSPSPFRPHIALAWKTTNLPLCGRNHRLLNARFILGSYYELRPPKSVARERYASVLQYKHTGCGGRGDLKTGQHARQAARRASHDTQERRLSFRYTRESVKVLCCVTTPAPYAVGRSMCMHLSKHLSPSPFRPHIALAWKTTNLPLCGRNHRLLNARFILGSYYELRPPKSVARERYASVPV